MEESGLLFYVDRERNKAFVDLGRNLLVGIGFGFQPNAPSSARRSAEVEKQRLVSRSSRLERFIDILPPLDCGREVCHIFPDETVMSGVALPPRPGLKCGRTLENEDGRYSTK